MQAGFSVWLDGQQFPAPTDWDKFTQELERDFDTRTISEKFRLTLTLTGGAHRYMADKYASEGFCAEVAIAIDQQCVGGAIRVLTGKIILSDCVWTLTACKVECSVVDDGIGACIHSNRKVSVSPLSDRSKNNKPITPVVPLSLTMFKSADGADISGTRRAFDWMAAIGHALAYISDGSVTVTSDWWDGLPDEERIAIAYGAELRTTSFEMPRLDYTFDDLFTEVAKRYNLWMHPTVSGGVVSLRIEPEATFLAMTDEAASMLALPDLKRSIDLDRLYATVRVGSEDAIKNIDGTHPLPYIPLMGFVDEAFHFTGVCNTDAELDLVGKWIADTNAIKAMVEDGDDGFDSKWFIIQYDRGTARATQGTYFNLGAPPYLYNERMINSAVLLRYPLPGPVGANYGATFDDSFLARRTFPTNAGETSQASFNADFPPYTQGPFLMRFDNDYDAPGFDANNTWGNGTVQGSPVSLADSRFTATGTGYYTFTGEMPWRISKFRPKMVLIGFPPYPAWRAIGIIRTFTAKVYDASNNLLSSVTVDSPMTRYIPGDYVDTLAVGLSLQPGNYVTFSSGWKRGANALFSAMPGSDFPYNPDDPDNMGFVGAYIDFQNDRCTVGTSMVQDGGVLQPSLAPHIVLHEFDRACPADRWVECRDYPERFVAIDNNVRGHVSHLKRDLLKGTATWTIISPP